MGQCKLRKFECIGCKKYVELRRPKNKTLYCSQRCFWDNERPQNKTGETVVCNLCGKRIYKKKHQLKHTNHFCSIKCANEYQGRKKIEFICRTCGNKFKWSKSRILHSNPTYCSITCRNSDTKFMTKCGINSTIKQQKKRGLNKLELKGREILKELGIRFNEQVLMFDKFLVDVLVKGQKVVIQWDGGYWHTKPKRVLLDKSQDAYLEKCGYKVLRITDKEIKNNIKQVYANITRTIQ